MVQNNSVEKYNCNSSRMCYIKEFDTVQMLNGEM